MNKKTISTFWDYSQCRPWVWVLQSVIFSKVKLYYDKEQKAYCREITGIRGTVRDGYFYPRKNLLVNYCQKI